MYVGHAWATKYRVRVRVRFCYVRPSNQTAIYHHDRVLANGRFFVEPEEFDPRNKSELLMEDEVSRDDMAHKDGVT